MIVVSNTSPINYLILIEPEHVLPAMFGTVTVPIAVRQELLSPGAPQRVRELIGTSRWVDVRTPAAIDPRLATSAPAREKR
jgi:predicted nucleic acid-binding protein